VEADFAMTIGDSEGLLEIVTIVLEVDMLVRSVVCLTARLSTLTCPLTVGCIGIGTISWYQN